MTRTGNWSTWGRRFPVRHLLVRRDDEGDLRLWGRAAGIEGLFVEEVPPEREVLTLRDFAPAGSDGERSGIAGLSGDMCIKVLDGTRPVEWWDLVDVAVIARLSDFGDPASGDVVIGAGVVESREGRVGLPASPGFELVGARGVTVGFCHRVEGLFRESRQIVRRPVTLVGCEPTRLLLDAMCDPTGPERAEAVLWSLDRSGRTMSERWVSLAVVDSRPSVLGGTLVDVTLGDSLFPLPLPLARPIWDIWYEGRPAEPNQWAAYSTAGRHEWLALTRPLDPDLKEADRSGGTYHLDGRFVTDIPGLHCAMSEALAGPGGYFGREWNAFNDCLIDGFGLAAPFTVVWHDSEVAARALAGDAAGTPGYFEDVVRLMRCRGVTVVLD